MTVALPKSDRWVCPECLAAGPIHGHQERTWRHLDTGQFKTFVHARAPRLNCPTHGIKQPRVAWAESGVAVHGVVRSAGDRLADEPRGAELLAGAGIQKGNV